MNQNSSNLTEQPPKASLSSNSFQKSQNSKLLSQKRDEYLEASRSQKIKVYLQNKRLAAVKALSNPDKFGQGLSLQEFIAQCEERIYTLQQINELVAFIYSSNLYRQYFGVIGFRKLLATKSPPIQPIIDAGVTPRLVEFLGREDQPQLQDEAAWTLSNLSSGTTEQTRKIVENGAIPALMKLLRSPHEDVRFKALWTLGNFAGDSASFRDMILQEEAIAPVVEILEKAISEGDKETIINANWVLANFSGTRPVPPFEEIKEILPAFAKVVMSQEDPEIWSIALFPVCYFSDGDSERIQRVIDTGVVPSLVKLMEDVSQKDLSVLVGCLRAIGNICLGSHEQVDMVLKIPGIMEKLFSALQSQNKDVRKEAASVIANITTGTPDHLEYILGNPEYLDLLLHVGIYDTSEARREVAVALKNALNSANREQMRILLEEKEIFGFFGKLIQEEDCQEVALEAMYNILILEAKRVPEGFSKASCLSWMEENDLLPVLEELEKHSNLRILKFAARILGACDQEKMKKK